MRSPTKWSLFDCSGVYRVIRKTCCFRPGSLLKLRTVEYLTQALSIFSLTTVSGVVKSLMEETKTVSSIALTPFAMIWHWCSYNIWSCRWIKLNSLIVDKILNHVF